jgi:hypothetical protein
LRPEYQAPTQTQSTQIALPGIDVEPETVITPVEQQKWPTLPKAQLAAIRDLLRTSSGEWTVAQIANQFTGKNTQKKLEAIAENLVRGSNAIARANASLRKRADAGSTGSGILATDLIFLNQVDVLVAKLNCKDIAFFESHPFGISRTN